MNRTAKEKTETSELKNAVDQMHLIDIYSISLYHRIHTLLNSIESIHQDSLYHKILLNKVEK